ncbi:hypothetical protein G5B37_04325 [Rasiella rasia]|uniref:Uncharacterized protein n=1 Tax=Rasiella rasia TaxID=2744027 RepID=A0A6G6GJX0_9FLAO|nr:carboxypeptidase-like regulatory domain-containing protein [Rasiella rasia]QIE58814.1 hypothetical protein G5B37_04325 [Rasiella rasia]
MKKSITVSIAEPCQEDWAAMSPTEKGKFCAACTKEVIDFTGATDEAIVTHVLKNNNVCGKFIPSQLNRKLTLERKTTHRFAPLAASFLIPFTLFATTNKNPVAQPQQKEFTSLGIGSMQSNAQITTKTPTVSDSTKTVTIIGTVTDINKLPLVGVNVLIKGTAKGTQTDFEGNYTIEVAPKQTLVFSNVGYISKEILISNVSNSINLQLQEDLSMMGEMVIMGGIGVRGSKFEEGPTTKPFGDEIGANLTESKTEETNSEKAMRNHKEFMKIKRAKAKAKRSKNNDGNR